MGARYSAQLLTKIEHTPLAWEASDCCAVSHAAQEWHEKVIRSGRDLFVFDLEIMSMLTECDLLKQNDA
jgi:hypothetical protein